MKISGKKYSIIYADPPWPYRKYSNTKKNTSDKIRVTPYPAMKLTDIEELPIQEISEENAVLFLWITMPCLEMGLKVIKAWGFTYKTVGFTWVKKNKKGVGWFRGFGHYTRSNAELCLLATKGKILPVLCKNLCQIIESPLTVHSEKPSTVRDKIVELFGSLSRIELFARTSTNGWDHWGNEIEVTVK